MALVKNTLKTGILNLLTEMRAKEEVSDEYFADQLSTLIDAYIKSATVTTVVTGTCQTPAGAGTIAGQGTGSLS
jgi:hypothetical protein